MFIKIRPLVYSMLAEKYPSGQLLISLSECLLSVCYVQMLTNNLASGAGPLEGGEDRKGFLAKGKIQRSCEGRVELGYMGRRQNMSGRGLCEQKPVWVILVRSAGLDQRIHSEVQNL